MLIINAENTDPSTERKALGFLRDYSSNPGIALSGLRIPDRHRRGGTEADIVVLTPFAAAVIEVEDILEPIGGTLSCPVDGRWSMPGSAGDPIRLRGNDINPLRHVAEARSDLQHLASEIEPGRDLFVDALVLVAPHPGTTVSLDKGRMPAGRDVLLGSDASQLWKWLNRKAFRARTDPWTAELVIDVLAEIGFHQACDPEEAATLRAALLREGFPAEAPATSAEPAPDVPVTEPAPELLVGVKADAPAPPEPSAASAGDVCAPAKPDTAHASARSAAAAPPDTEPFGRPLTEPPVSVSPPPRDIPQPLPPRYPAAAGPRPPADSTRRFPEPESDDEPAPKPFRRPPRHRVEAVVVIGALAAVLIGFVWYFTADGSRPHSDAGNRPTPTSTAGAPPPAPVIPPAPAAPAAAEVPAPQPDSGLFPQDARACYPFQAGC
ncbi:nuclease-related domain-containing protein [Nocardia spumae]|uniref:nuclease-related domain-containing protein n=1 Tax=Nocardia spumae TaxID=2887190 RepID=UPI001D1450D9|nr:nuclease-related domain-containing protein [Nocardia spumae]